MARTDEGETWLSGRYRNYGDSRTGLQAGQRGVECVLFRLGEDGRPVKQASWSKADLSRPGREVLSIEGTALYRRADGVWELYVSSEKAISYPPPLSDYQKPGTGVWTIDRMTGSSPDTLDVTTLAPVLENDDRAEYLHVKDPVVFDGPGGDTHLVFCSHPYSWSSGNTGLATRQQGAEHFQVVDWEMVSRGTTWDVASTRITNRLPVPAAGAFGEQPASAVYFYDGCECVRSHEENPLAHKRPRGYSCEELGGAMWGSDEVFPELERLSTLSPLFVSPWGTGASRYVASLVTDDGIWVTWEQSQSDGSQPLVGNWLPMLEVEHILSSAE